VRSALASPQLRRLIVAYTVNRLGTWFGMVALSLAVYDHTHSAVAVAALLFAGQALPAFVVPGLVARMEVSRRGREITGLYLFEALATASLAVLLWHFWLPAILLLAALDGTAALAASGLLRAAAARVAREHVGGPEEQGSPARDSPSSGEGLRVARDDEGANEAAHNANAALNLAFSATFVLGPVLAGVVVGAAGAPTALFIDVGSFLLCGALLIDLRSHVEEAGSDSMRARLQAALEHIRAVPGLRALLLADAVAMVFFQSAGPVEVVYAKSTLNAGDRGYGLLLTVWGVGAVLGGLVFARLVRRPLAPMLGLSALAIGLAYAGFAAAPSLTVACAAALIGGAGNGVEIPSMIGVVQRLTPQRLHGRLMGAVESLGAVSLAFGLPLGGALVALGSPRAAFLTIALGTVATAAVLLHISRGRKEAAGEQEPRGSERPAGQLGKSLITGPRATD
jgi:hypothetical protein